MGAGVGRRWDPEQLLWHQRPFEGAELDLASPLKMKSPMTSGEVKGGPEQLSWICRALL